MRTLSYRQYIQAARRVNERMKDKRPQSALVRRVDGVRVDLIVGRSNVVIKNVEVIGDCSQVAPGDTVQIAWWDGDRPVAIVGANLGGLDGRMGAAEKRLAAINIVRPVSSPHITGGISDWQIIRFSNGSLSSVHEPDENGMQDALDVSRPGDNILLPTIQLAMSFSLPQGVIVTGISRFGSIILGTVRLAAGSALETLRVLCKLNSAETALAVQGPLDGQARINNCDLWAWNCGDGEAIGALAEGGAFYIQKSYLAGETKYGRGMATKVVSGKLQLEDCRLYSDTEPVGEVSVYGTLVGEMGSDCPSPISNSLLGYDEYQYNPNALYALPGGNTAVEIPFRPWMHSKKYIYGVDPADRRIVRLDLANMRDQKIETFIAFDERQDWTVFSDDVIFIFNQPSNQTDRCWLRKVDFSTGIVDTVASWEQGDYTYNRLWKCGIIPSGNKIVMFGCVVDANDKLKFFYRFFDAKAETLGPLNIVDITGTSADDYFGQSLDLAGTVYGSNLVVVLCPVNTTTAPIVAAILDINLDTETLIRTSSSTLSNYDQFQIDSNLVACAEGIVFKISGFSGAYSSFMKYDITGNAIASVPITSDDPDDMIEYGTRTKFYALVQENTNWVVKDLTGATVMSIPTAEATVPEHRTFPAIVDDRLWIIVQGKYTGYKIGHPNDKVEIQTPVMGERYDDFMICEGYIIHSAANQMELGDKYYLVK